MRNRKKLEVTIHELLHACFPDLTELVIDAASIDISKVLWALDYREKPNTPE
jgi:hypothetical protein